MLFNSYVFIFLFLPVTLLGYYLVGGRGYHRIAISWLVAASLFFYGWWNPAYLGLILGSILFNYTAGVALLKSKAVFRKSALTFGVCVNLALLGYFKYANFFVDNFNLAFDTTFHIEHIFLPLAISFFTFQQIAYLVDAYKRETREYNFLHYCLFVVFFPQLIAGPIVHHKEMLPQFVKAGTYSLNQKNLAIGITIFILGLFKKVVFADSVAAYATPVFDAAELGIVLTFAEAWMGALAYTMQLYFDFSGYSDMAIGLAYMFSIRLPINFNSPYQSLNIIDFWRRWHMTLSRFLRDYLYIPLGGSRKGSRRRYINLMITMLLGGLWHGAGWTFVFWGTLHGLYLGINHAWRGLRRILGHDLERTTFLGRGAAWILTFFSVVVGWVFFRAESFSGALNILDPMLGMGGLFMGESLQTTVTQAGAGPSISNMSFETFLPNNLFENNMYGISLIVVLLAIAKFSRNGIEIVLNKRPGRFVWSPRLSYAVIMAGVFSVCIFNIRSHSEFLYFQF